MRATRMATRMAARMAAIRELHSDGYRKVPHSTGATGGYAFDEYRRTRDGALVDLALYPDGRTEIINFRTSLA